MDSGSGEAAKARLMGRLPLKSAAPLPPARPVLVEPVHLRGLDAARKALRATRTNRIVKRDERS